MSPRFYTQLEQINPSTIMYRKSVWPLTLGGMSVDIVTVLRGIKNTTNSHLMISLPNCCYEDLVLGFVCPGILNALRCGWWVSHRWFHRPDGWFGKGEPGKCNKWRQDFGKCLRFTCPLLLNIGFCEPNSCRSSFYIWVHVIWLLNGTFFFAQYPCFTIPIDPVLSLSILP